MKDLIEALTIFLKYGNLYNPTHCEHDKLTVAIDPTSVSKEDIERLKTLGFNVGDCSFYSFRFGSC